MLGDLARASTSTDITVTPPVISSLKRRRLYNLHNLLRSLAPCAAFLSCDPLHQRPWPLLRNDVKLVHLSMLPRAKKTPKHLVSMMLDHTFSSTASCCASYQSFNAYLFLRIHVVKSTNSGSSASLLTTLFANFPQLVLGAICKVAWVGMGSLRCVCRCGVASKAQTKERIEWI